MNTTKLADVAERLRRQAQGTDSADNQGNLADYTWMLNHQGVTVGTDIIWDELCCAFEDLNELFNVDPEPHLTRATLYAVNGLLTLCLNQAMTGECDESVRSRMLKLAWRISVAWDAVLAGDIESIEEHVYLEESARAIE